MGYARLAGRLYGAPLLITPDKAEVIESVFRSYVDGQGKRNDGPDRGAQEASYLDTLLAINSIGVARRAEGGYVLTQDGIAILPVVGSLVHRATMFDAESGLTSYARIGAMLDAAMADYRVEGIVLDVDSPGGEGAGVIELAARIEDAAKRKPVYAVANEHAFSAAYWIASAAGRLIVPSSGMVGSVGVVMLHVDQSRANERRGLEVTHIHAGARKVDFSPHAPLSDRARASAQAMVDRMYGQFVDAVANYRGVDAQVVRDTEAALLNADEAISLGMADDVGTLADAVALMRAERRSGERSYGRRAEAPVFDVFHDMVGGTDTISERTEAMNEPKDKPAAAANAVTVTADQLATERAAGFAEGNATGRVEGASAERARVRAITTCDAAKDRPALAAHLAFDTDMPIEAAQALLTKAAKEVAAAPANPLAAAMEGTNPKVGADVDKSGSNVVRIDTAGVYNRLNATLADAHKSRR